MKIFMLGWEFPPFISGGLGTACYGLTQALNGLGVDVVFVLPRAVASQYVAHVKELQGTSPAGTPAAAAETPQPVTAVLAPPPPSTPIVSVAPTPSAAPNTAPPPATTRASEPVPVPPSPPAPAAPQPPAPAAPQTDYVAVPRPRVGTMVRVGSTLIPVQKSEVVEHVSYRTVDVLLTPYMTPVQYQQALREYQLRVWTETQAVETRETVEVPLPDETPAAMPVPVPAASATPPASAALAQEAAAIPAVQPLPRERLPESPQVAMPASPAPHAAPAIPPVHVPLAPAPPPPAPAPSGMYAGDLMGETERYAALAAAIAADETFDLVHAHDWMTYRAGMAVAKATGKPLVVHVHSTEYDRAGGHANPEIVAIERAGMEAAELVIVVSHLTEELIRTRYGIPAEKIRVVHNGVDSTDWLTDTTYFQFRPGEKIVLFLGRVTQQKGPEYFLRAAKRLVEMYPNVKFVMAGTGDLIRRSIDLASELGIGHKLLFTGFLQQPDVERLFRLADLYVMPSVSEPFGLAPLEALSHDVPILISKQSGVSEVIRHALKADFWNVDDLADQILAVLRHPPLQRTLREEGAFEVRQLNWFGPAEKVKGLYETLAAKKTQASRQQTLKAKFPPPKKAPAKKKKK